MQSKVPAPEGVEPRAPHGPELRFTTNYMEAIGHEGTTLQEVAARLSVPVACALYDLRILVNLGTVAYDPVAGAFRHAVDRRTCHHRWRAVRGSLGLVDRCELCGEERA